MSGRKVIEVGDIKAGDLIRYEGDAYSSQTRAIEFIASRDGGSYVPGPLGGRHYLLDRPKPVVKLPDDGERELAWAEWGGKWGRRLAVWRVDGKNLVPDADTTTFRGRISALKSFTPAVAVPTEALEKLRADESATYRSSDDDRGRNYARKEAIETFLAAIDGTPS